MGRPVHYSSEVPARCQDLIDTVGPLIEADAAMSRRWEGPLKSTFLLAMATPMVVLPLERIFKPLIWGKVGVVNDVDLDPALDDRVRDVLGGGHPFGAAPFYRAGVWRRLPEVAKFPVGVNWPGDLLDALGDARAEAVAADAGASRMLIDLRNALAHGGVTYLDANGRHTERATNMLGFVSRVEQNDPNRFCVLRVSVAGFEDFLRAWARWLTDAGVTDALVESGPGYFGEAA